MEIQQQIEIIIARYFSNTCTVEEKRILLSWIHENEENRKYFQHLQNIWHVSNPEFKPEDIDTEIALSRLLSRINQQKSGQGRKMKLIQWWQRVAAILLLPVIAFTLYQNLTESLPEEFVAYQEITSPAGMKSEVKLPDGTKVWLNAGSKLKYPLRYSSKKRHVSLTGEAYFEVHSDKQHPFIVSTPAMDIEATGTAFNVEAYSNDTITAVTLLEGKVDINLNNQLKKKLLPNQRVTYNSLSRKVSINQTDAVYWCSWKDGILVFRDESLEDIFKRIGRTFNVEIVIKDRKIAKQIYRATFEGETLNEILNLLKLSAPIKYKRTGREKLINNEYSKERIEVYSSK